MTAPSPPLRSYEAELESLTARIEALELASRSPQLGGSSIDDGTLQVRGSDGTILQTWGVQPDGTAGTKSLNKVPPPAPGAADVTPTIAGLDLAWSGQLTGTLPADFRAVRFHLSIVPDFIVGDSNYVGSLSRAGSIPVAPLPYVTHYCKMVAVNQAGAVSMPSLQASGTPKKVVADAVTDGIITATSLADGAVTKAKVAAGAVTQTAIAPGSIGTPQLIAGSVQAAQLAVDSVQAGNIVAGTLTGREIKALSLTGDKIAANSIDAGHVKAGAVTADKLAATLALASRLIAGDPTGTRVELSASGMLVIRANGDTTFQVDSSTGDVTSMGQYYTSRYGERIAMNVAGLSEPTIRAYPRRGNRYADLRSYTRTIGSTDIANWEFRLPLQGQEAGLVDFMVYNSSFQPISSSRLRYRPFFNSSGVVHCGWAADGQNAAVVFFDGQVFIVNSANSARAPLRCGGINAAGNIAAPGGNISTDPSGSMNSLHYYGGTFHGVFDNNSDARLKENFAPVRDEDLDQLLEAPVQRWNYRHDVHNHDPDVTHVGPVAQDMPDVAVSTNDDGHLGIDQTTFSGLLLGLVQRQARRIRALEDRLDQIGAA